MSSTADSTTMPAADHQSSFPAPPVTVVITIVTIILFLLGLFSIYFCRCFLESLLNGWQFVGRIPNPGRNAVNPNSANPADDDGLDPALIERFPTVPYSCVKEFRRDKHELECAICLVEFEEDDLLRVVIMCYHAFHPDCIDLWLRSHKTCPVCRQDLDLVSRDSLEKTSLNLLKHINSMSEDERSGPLEHSITINNNGVIDRDRDRDQEEEATKMRSSKKFTRSHSTGHSIVVSRSSIGDHGEDEDDGYTLKLMQNVKVKMVDGPNRHCPTGNCITFGEFSGPQKAINDVNMLHIGCVGFEEVAGGTSTSIVV